MPVACAGIGSLRRTLLGKFTTTGSLPSTKQAAKPALRLRRRAPLACAELDSLRQRQLG